MTLGANPYSDIPFPDPVCKNHPDRHPVEPMAFRWCAECKAEAQARYADNHRATFDSGKEWDTRFSTTVGTGGINK